MNRKPVQRVATLSITLASLIITAQPVSAAHDSLECTPPEDLQPLIDLLHSIGEIAFLAGVTIGTIGFLFAGICLMLPGEDWTRRGKNIATNVFIGVILLLSANMIVAYLVSQVGGSFCP